jgi:hypothetical protein
LFHEYVCSRIGKSLTLIKIESEKDLQHFPGGKVAAAPKGRPGWAQTNFKEKLGEDV